MTDLVDNLPMTEILTGALVVITGFYAWATYQISKANKRTGLGSSLASCLSEMETPRPKTGASTLTDYYLAQ